MSHPHIVVVGAGIIGASIAYHLVSEHNVDVTVVTPTSGIGGVATPNSFAWINANRGNTRTYYNLRKRSMGRWRHLTDAVPGLSKLVQWTGTIQWNGSEEELAKFVDEHTEWGYNIHKVTHAEIAQLEPGLSAPPQSAVQARDEGSVEPALAAQLLVEEARRKGAKIVAGTVKSLVSTDGRVSGLVLEDETEINADHVVLAAGVESVKLCSSVGVDLPVYPRPGLLAHSKPVSKRLLNGIVLSAGPHLRQTTEGRMVIGADFSGGTIGNLSPEEQRQAALTLIEKAKTLFCPEGAALLELDYYTVGERPQPKDGLPIVDPAVLPGLAVAVMHSGVTLAALIGELVAKAVVTNEVDSILVGYSLKRFSNQ